MPDWMRRRPAVFIATCCVAAQLAGCASRAVDVRPRPASPEAFGSWDCTRITDELDRVQQRAADVAYAVDERAGDNIIALGVGLAVFWPALLAMRPDGLEAEDLARLKGRYEALSVAAARKRCPPPGEELSPQRAAQLPVALGDRLVYEERGARRGPLSESSWQVVALRRDEIEFALPAAGGEPQSWRQDLAGNVVAAPPGTLRWQRVLRRELALGQVVAGEFGIADDPLVRARVRGQVVAVGPQSVAARRFDVAVIELFGDVQRGEAISRLEGAMTVDRASGVLLRLDLRSAVPGFTLQRRLARVEASRP